MYRVPAFGRPSHSNHENNNNHLAKRVAPTVAYTTYWKIKQGFVYDAQQAFEINLQQLQNYATPVFQVTFSNQSFAGVSMADIESMDQLRVSDIQNMNFSDAAKRVFTAVANGTRFSNTEFAELSFYEQNIAQTIQAFSNNNGGNGSENDNSWLSNDRRHILAFLHGAHYNEAQAVLNAMSVELFAK